MVELQITNLFIFSFPFLFMRPPICAICGVKFIPPKEGELVYFLVRKQKEGTLDKVLGKVKKTIGVDEKPVEHPENAEWFCTKHMKKAQELALTMEIREAMSLLTTAEK